MRGTVIKPKADGTLILLLGAPTIHDVDDPLCIFVASLSLISKDFTGGVVIVELGLNCFCARDVC